MLIQQNKEQEIKVQKFQQIDDSDPSESEEKPDIKNDETMNEYSSESEGPENDP